jgi:hypothetical protein
MSPSTPTVSSQQPDEEQGALSAGYIFGYRLALLVGGAGALYIADIGIAGP